MAYYTSLPVCAILQVSNDHCTCHLNWQYWHSNKVFWNFAYEKEKQNIKKFSEIPLQKKAVWGVYFLSILQVHFRSWKSNKIILQVYFWIRK